MSKPYLLPARILPVILIAVVAVLLLSGCGVFDDDPDEPGTTATDGTGPNPTPAPEDDGSATNQGAIRVIDSAMSTEVDDQIQASGVVANAFPPDVRQIHIVLVLDGVGPGTEITGRWYQMVDDGPPSGTEINAAGITLTEENVVQGAARVALNLGAGPEGFPVDDYVVRVYAGEEFIKTSSFVISRFVVHPAAGEQAPGAEGQPPVEPTAPPEGPPTEAPPAPIQETYTVVEGDTLTIIAEQFRPPEEPVENYVQRLLEANQLDPAGTLIVGQVLQIPGPLPPP